MFYLQVQNKVNERKCSTREAISLVGNATSNEEINKLNTRYYESKSNPLVSYINDLDDEQKNQIIKILT